MEMMDVNTADLGWERISRSARVHDITIQLSPALKSCRTLFPLWLQLRAMVIGCIRTFLLTMNIFLQVVVTTISTSFHPSFSTVWFLN